MAVLRCSHGTNEGQFCRLCMNDALKACSNNKDVSELEQTIQEKEEEIKRLREQLSNYNK